MSIDVRIGVVGLREEQWSVGHDTLYDVLCELVTKLSNERKVWTRVSCYRNQGITLRSQRPSLKVSLFGHALKGKQQAAYNFLKTVNPVYDVMTIEVDGTTLLVKIYVTDSFKDGVLNLVPYHLSVDCRDSNDFSKFTDKVEELLNFIDHHTVDDTDTTPDPSHDRNGH